MPVIGSEPTIAVFESKKTFHALDRAATVISKFSKIYFNLETKTAVLLLHLHMFQALKHAALHGRFRVNNAAIAVLQQVRTIHKKQIIEFWQIVLSQDHSREGRYLLVQLRDCVGIYSCALGNHKKSSRGQASTEMSS
jgi:predicted ABC-class ATPase